MQINYTTNAFETLIQLVNFIETTNTEGAGMRWLSRYEIFLQKKLLNPQQIKLCLNSTFNKLNLRCVYFNDWLIAFSVHENFTLVEAILHKSRISDYVIFLLLVFLAAMPLNVLSSSTCSAIKPQP